MDVMLYEPKIDSKKDVESMWQLVCGKIQYKTNFPTVNMGLLEGGGGVSRGEYFFYDNKYGCAMQMLEM